MANGGQKRLESLLEVVLNVGSGFIVAMGVNWLIVIPLWNLKWTILDNFGVTAIFTAVAIARGYAWRRLFNAQVHRLVHRWVSLRRGTRANASRNR